TPGITFYRPMNFHLFSFKPAYVANILQGVRKNDSREGAHAVGFTENQIMHAAKALLYTNHAACNAADFADVRKRLRKWCTSAKNSAEKRNARKAQKPNRLCTSFEAMRFYVCTSGRVRKSW